MDTGRRQHSCQRDSRATGYCRWIGKDVESTGCFHLIKHTLEKMESRGLDNPIAPRVFQSFFKFGDVLPLFQSLSSSDDINCDSDRLSGQMDGDAKDKCKSLYLSTKHTEEILDKIKTKYKEGC